VWLAGVIALLLITSLPAAILVSQSEEASKPRTPRSLPVVVSNYTQLAGNVAALCLAAVVFIATLAPESPVFDTSIGLFILAFLVLVTSAMEFATTPSLASDEADADPGESYLSFLVANLSFYLGLALSWLGLRLLVLALELDHLADLLTWVLLLAIIMGSFRLCMHIYRYTSANSWACVSLLAVSLAAAASYRFLFAEGWDDLWPADDGPLLLSVVAFAATGLGYLYQTLLFATHGQPNPSRLLSEHRSALLCAYTQGVLTLVVLAWIAVAQTSR
jgi:hypothetical protein